MSFFMQLIIPSLQNFQLVLFSANLLKPRSNRSIEINKWRLGLVQGNLYTEGRLLYQSQSSTNCRIGCWQIEKYFFTNCKQPSPQLVDDCTCGTIPFPLYRDFPASSIKLGLHTFDLINKIFEESKFNAIFYAMLIRSLGINMILNTNYNTSENQK